MSTGELYRRGFGPFTPGFKVVAYGDPEALETAITLPNTASFLMELIQGEAGVRVPPDGYLKSVRTICDHHNVLFTADEIQSRLGRCRKWSACAWAEVTPDMITIGKALSGGMLPVSAVIGRRDVLALFEPGSHGSTFGGSPLACAVARGSLRVVADEKLPERARELGAYFRNGLREMDSPLVREIRRKGLLIGVQLKRKAGPARRFVKHLQQRRELAKETHGTVIRFAPPLIMSKDDIDLVLAQLRAVLAPTAWRDPSTASEDPTPRTVRRHFAACALAAVLPRARMACGGHHRCVVDLTPRPTT